MSSPGFETVLQDLANAGLPLVSSWHSYISEKVHPSRVCSCDNICDHFHPHFRYAEDGPRSPKRIQDECFHDHIHWDPGGVKSFNGTTPPDENPTKLYITCTTNPEQNGVHALDEGQLKESKGTVGLKNKPEDDQNGLGNIQTTQAQPNKGSENTDFLDKVQESVGSHGSAIMKPTSSSMNEKVSSPLEGSVVMSHSSIPVTDNSYVLGLRPIVCSETYTQLDRASYVTGMLPFMK